MSIVLNYLWTGFPFDTNNIHLGTIPNCQRKLPQTCQLAMMLAVYLKQIGLNSNHCYLVFRPPCVVRCPVSDLLCCSIIF